MIVSVTRYFFSQSEQISTLFSSVFFFGAQVLYDQCPNILAESISIGMGNNSALPFIYKY
jgi:hypothetical protein